MESAVHRSEVVAQFTRQSRLFAEHQAHSENRSLEVFRDLGRFCGDERVLDSGCGPGLVSRYLARWVSEVVGVDLTPTMVSFAAEAAAEEGHRNTMFLWADMTDLPFAAATFDGAISRYAFHHLQEPALAFSEMCRVTRPGGRVIVMDATPEDLKRDDYDAFERLRDPSHTSALTEGELAGLGSKCGLGEPEMLHFGLEMNVRSLVDSSFPRSVTRDELVELLRADRGGDRLSFQVREGEEGLMMTFPITAAAWQR